MKLLFDVRPTCPRTVGLIELFDGLLPADQAEDWGSHLDHCSVCQAQFELLAAQSAPLLSVDPGVSSPHLAAARQQLLAAGRSGLGQNRDATETETPPSTTHADPPHRIGQYSDLQVIGRGGMGVVYRAFDDVLRRVVAIKQLSPHLSASAAARERFVREAQAAAAVVHEHVVSIYSVEEHESVPFIVMQFVPGENLQERIDRAGPLELRETLRIGIEIALGLAAAHAEAVMHRDIKPSNILLENGVTRVKITDFGLARVAAAAGLTQKGEAPGTPEYMSAEQARGEGVDCRSDLFSLGSVLYAMCTGRPPFEADTVLGTLRLVADLPAKPIRELNPDIPAWLAGIIERLHAKSPQERYQTAEDVATILLAHFEDLRSGRTKRTGRWWVAAATVGVAGGLVAYELTGITSPLTTIAGFARDASDARVAAASRHQTNRLETPAETASPGTKAVPSVPKTELSAHSAQAKLRSQIEAMDAALERDPADIRSLLNRALLYVSLDESDRAIADYTRLILGPGEDFRYVGPGLTGRAQIYAQRGDWPAAIDDYSRYLDVSPASGAHVYGQLAMIYLAGPESVRNPQKALELARIAVQMPDVHAGHRTVLGAALYRVGQYREAAETLTAAARKKDGYTPFNQFFLTMTWRRLGETEKAQRYYAVALDMDTHIAGPLAERGLRKLLRAEAEALLEIVPRKD